MNAPDRFELFLLGDGEKKVTEEQDTRKLMTLASFVFMIRHRLMIDLVGIPSSSIFTFNKEDHTLGNLLSSRLLQSPHVTFSGYKVPHPLIAQFILRIQTDGTLTPRQALNQASKDLIADFQVLSREFTKEWELRKMVGDTGKSDDRPNGR
ncbi:uncharacterized protein KY384_009031 [Bacidia gigantensis]|uniref:uncharacterized protein n=1 Tax=Bacidia gigantensis TaxID=2732470 RepID=UPI001D0378BD|nr:uncharacterized protein KY384_009031 [Bacidia gigantensis]KAG8525387.1 hypothetical protein KY384_009031 [Bacidia gigantensis]